MACGNCDEAAPIASQEDVWEGREVSGRVHTSGLRATTRLRSLSTTCSLWEAKSLLILEISSAVTWSISSWEVDESPACCDAIPEPSELVLVDVDCHPYRLLPVLELLSLLGLIGLNVLGCFCSGFLDACCSIYCIVTNVELTERGHQPGLHLA